MKKKQNVGTKLSTKMKQKKLCYYPDILFSLSFRWCTKTAQL